MEGITANAQVFEYTVKPDCSIFGSFDCSKAAFIILSGALAESKARGLSPN